MSWHAANTLLQGNRADLTGLSPRRSYSRYVARSVQNIDTLLKIIMSPDDPADEFVRHYLLLVPCQSFSDFQKLLELKVRLFRSCRRCLTSVFMCAMCLQGVRRAEQNHLLDVFLAKTSTASGLSDTSFLTTLDMDPPSNSLTSPSDPGLQSPTIASGTPHHLGLFGFGGSGPSLPGLPGVGGTTGASREASRAGTPAGTRDQGQEKGPAFARLGARFGTRFFGGGGAAAQ